MRRLGETYQVQGSANLPENIWVYENRDEVALLKEEFSGWLSWIGKNEKLFEQNVYKNPNMNWLDLHQHRARLFALMSHGESLIVKFYELGAEKKIEPEDYFKLIQKNLESLAETFNTWHGPLNIQEDIPEDFKEGIRDIAEGKILDLDKALTEKFPDAAAVQGV